MYIGVCIAMDFKKDKRRSPYSEGSGPQISVRSFFIHRYPAMSRRTKRCCIMLGVYFNRRPARAAQLTARLFFGGGGGDS